MFTAFLAAVFALGLPLTAPARAASVDGAAPVSVRTLGAFLASPAPDFETVRGLGSYLGSVDLADPAAAERLKSFADVLRAETRRILETPIDPKANEAGLLAASHKLALLNDPAFRNLLTPDQQRGVGAAFWAYNTHLIEDVRSDVWSPSKLTLAEKIEGIAKALEASRAAETPGSAPALSQNDAVKVEAVAGDVSKLKASALVAAVQLSGLCHGGVNAMIERVGGSAFRRQVEAAKPLADGRTLVAKGDRANKGLFENVVFVADDMRLPLRELVSRGLRAADEAGFKSITLPALRTGWNFGFLEKTYEEVAAETVKGVNDFLAAGRKSVEKISLVVQNNPRLLSLLQAVKPADPEREALREVKLSGKGYELTPRPRPVPESQLRSPIHRDRLEPWNLSRMLERRAPLRVGTIKNRAAFSSPAPSVLNLPIKMPGTGFRIPAELEPMREFLQKIVDYEAAVNPRLGEFYAYLTVDQGQVKKGDYHRRPGIHIDGVQGSRYPEKMPPEHTYSASDAVGTVFYAQPFDVRHIDPDRDYIHGELERQADEGKAVATGDYGIYHWDSYSAHRAAVADKDTPRTFVRVEFSKKVYDSVGDTVSPLFAYDWPRVSRPIPYELNWRAEALAKVAYERREARRVAVEFAAGVDPSVARRMLSGLGLKARKRIEKTAGGFRLEARARGWREVAPAARALSREPGVVKIALSSQINKLWDLVVDYPALDQRTAFPEVGRTLEDKTVVEGSKGSGGSQTDFLIDHADADLRRQVLEPARAIGASRLDDWTKLRELQALVNRVIPRDGDRNGRGNKNYDRYISVSRGRSRVSLGDYVRMRIGVCRENALLTVVALRAAGYKARFAYFKVYMENGEDDQDHALALVEVGGTTYILDSYRPLGRYYNGHRLVDLLQPPADGKYPLASPLAAANARDPGRWSLKLNPFPAVRP